MPIYTYESSNTLSRLANKLVIVDTSYLQDLSDPNEENFPIVFPFHRDAVANNTKFVLNVVVRQEFLKLVRKSLLIDAMLTLAQSDARIEDRYRAATNIRTNPLSYSNLNGTYERIYKDHLKLGDADLLLNALNRDFWHEVQLLEAQANIAYVGAPSVGSITWESLGILMQNTGMAPTDAMIANCAFSIGADAILTTDTDYAPVGDLIDVYMPDRLATQCAAYDLKID